MNSHPSELENALPLGYHRTLKIQNPGNSLLSPLLGAILTIATPLDAEVTVSAPVTITHRVQVQPIRVKKTDGTTATTFGETAEATYIRQQINRIWAQVGVRIDWLPFTDYTSDSAYQGTGDYSENPRPDADLAAIVNGAGSPPKSPNAIVINLFFVGIAPGFPQSEGFSVNGRAFLDSNGVALHVDEELLAFEEGLDGIAAVAAHEIGHNLGLDHYEVTENLMNASVGPVDYLTNGQKTIVFTNNAGTDGYEFLQVAPPPSNYAQWAVSHGLEGGADEDDDQDHIDNVIEFMLGLNPNTPSALPVPVFAANGLTWTFPKNAAALADGLVYQVESANTLGPWLAAGTAGSGSTVVTNNSSSLVVRLDSGGSRRFIRLNVDSSPVASGAAGTFILPAGNPEFRVLPATACGWTAPGVSSPP